MSTITKSTTSQLTPPTPNDLSPYAGPWGREQVTHLLRRTMFGARKSDIDYFVGKGKMLSILELLNDKVVPAPPLNFYEDKTNADPTKWIVDPGAAFAQTWVNAKRDGNYEGYRLRSFRAWWMGQMLNQRKSIKEKMVLFLHNLLATEFNDIGDGRYAYSNNKLLRDNCLGNYKALLKAFTLDPLVLVYLNGRLNRKQAPDENYGRELQELFTVGKGAGSGYTENDVKAAAKVLTGYSDVADPIGYKFTAGNHDTTNKQFSAFYGNKIINGKTLDAGQQELDELLDMIFSTNEVSLYLCRRIYTFFVYYEITPEIETKIIVPLAAKFKSSGYNLKTVMETLLSSNHFFDASVSGAVLKSPIDFVVGTAREFGFKFPSGSNADLSNQYKSWENLTNISRNMLQDIGNPPNVAGWQAYYQAPQYHEIWINTDTIPRRNSFTDTIANGNGYVYGSYKVGVNIIEYFKTFKAPQDPNKLVAELVERAYVRPLTAASLAVLKNFLITGQTDNYWTLAWNDYLKTPTDANKLKVVVDRLKALLQNLFKFAEYHLS